MNKTALITGANKGIGLGISKYLGLSGWDIIIGARNEARASIAKYKWGLANLVVSLRLNTFTKIELEKWLNEPFTPPPELAGEE